MRRQIFVMFALAGGIVCAAACHRAEAQGQQEKIAMKPPAGPAKRPQGSAALTVKPGAAEPFTKDDVAAYFKTHNLPMNSSSTSDFRVDALEFLTSKQVTDRLQGASPGLADNDRVAFATLTGTFTFGGPPKGKIARFSRAYAVFDATSGNLLMAGTLDQAEQPK